MIKPLNKHILVEVEKIEENKFGVLITKENQLQERGKVLTSDFPGVMKGETVYFKTYSAIPVKVEGKDLKFVKGDEILGKE